MAYSDLIYEPNFPNSRRQGNAVTIYTGMSASGVPNSGVVLRGDVVSYSGWVTAYSGKFRQQNVT